MNKQQYTYILPHEKNGFAEISKNLVRYRSDNNFIGGKGVNKIIM